MNEKEIKKTLALHKLWLDGDKKGVRANLSYADLRGADLRGANLSRADLFEADLSVADLRGADLSNSSLYRAKLNGADLRGANLSGADFRAALLSRANLSNTIYADQAPVIINTEYYALVITKDKVKIDCKSFSKKEIKTMTIAKARKIDGDTAVAFWKKYKYIVLANIRGNKS